MPDIKLVASDFENSFERLDITTNARGQLEARVKETANGQGTYFYFDVTLDPK